MHANADWANLTKKDLNKIQKNKIKHETCIKFTKVNMSICITQNREKTERSTH